MSYIYCTILMFELHQRIILFNENGDAYEVGIANLDNLSEMIVDVCEKYNVENVRLSGNKKFATSIAEDIVATCITKYGNSYIEVEVI